MEIDGMDKCEAPELRCDDIGPHLHDMQKHGMGKGCDYTNVPFNDSILPVSINSTEQFLLITCIKMIAESLGCEDPLVTMDVLHTDVVSFCKHFEIFLGFKSRLDCCIFLTVCM